MTKPKLTPKYLAKFNPKPVARKKGSSGDTKLDLSGGKQAKGKGK